MSEIFIICNSPEALDLIGILFPTQFSRADLFTCNNAFTFFRTKGKHFNFWTDARDIFKHLELTERLSGGYNEHIQHVYSRHGLTMATGNILFNDKVLKLTPHSKGASSALGALAYCATCLNYDRIVLVGYTLNEQKNDIWKIVNDRYKETERYEVTEHGNPYLFIFDKVKK
jgi:hypothetical protein